MEISISRKLIVLSIGILVGNAFLGYAVYKSYRSMDVSEELVQHTEQVIAQSVKIYAVAKDVETNSRGFVITKDSTFLAPLNTSGKTIQLYIGQLKQLIRDNAIQQRRADSLDFFLHKFLNFSFTVVKLRSNRGLATAVALISGIQGKYYMARIRQITNSIQQEQVVLLKQRNDTNAINLIIYHRFSIAIFILMAVFNILLLIAIGKYLFQSKDKKRRAAELVIANKELHFQKGEKEKRASELLIANKELSFQSREKGKRAAELVVANEELFYQNKEKGHRAAELVIANHELIHQNVEKENREAELAIANKELLYQNEEKEKRAAELILANIELSFQNKEKEHRAAELIIANKELLFQNNEKEKRAVELFLANSELLYQNSEKERRAAELIINESRLKEAQALTHIGNFEIDLLSYSVVWSDEMFKIYGLVKGEVTPSIELYLSFIHPDDVDNIRAAINKSFSIFKSSAFGFRFIRKDGIIRYGYSEARYEPNKGKNPVRLYGILQDVTESKLAEIERTKMLNDLVVRNNDLEQFAYIISHNLRAPIANIIGASSALNDIDLSIEDKEMLNTGIRTSVMKLDDIVQDLNHILDVKSDVNLNKEVVVFSKLVDEIKISIKNMIDKYDIEIKYDFSAIDGFLTLKPYVYSIFYNLISNSVKYRRQDVPCMIKLQSEIIDSAIKLTFADNGTGIDLAKNGHHVFGLYKRFHTNIEGKGMGLYMVKTQVETLGGTIKIQSEVNKGTEFEIEFVS